MRINVYSQELTDEVLPISKESNTGLVYSAVQFILHSSERLHHPPQDDDRSAVTFWLPHSPERREALAVAFERAAALVRELPSEDSPMTDEDMTENNQRRASPELEAAANKAVHSPPSDRALAEFAVYPGLIGVLAKECTRLRALLTRQQEELERMGRARDELMALTAGRGGLAAQVYELCANTLPDAAIGKGERA